MTSNFITKLANGACTSADSGNLQELRDSVPFANLVVGSPGTNLAGSSNLAGCLPHELVINLGKVESNMAGIL